MDYHERQKASGIEVGDNVKVIRIAKGREKGWGTGWDSEMDNYVGKTFEVIDVSNSCGFYLTSLNRDSYVFPYFVLEIVEESDD